MLSASVAALMADGLVTMERVAQDGMRVRASAGAASFRRGDTLDAALAEAEAAGGGPAHRTRRRPRGHEAPGERGRERAARERADGSAGRSGSCPQWRRPGSATAKQQGTRAPRRPTPMRGHEDGRWWLPARLQRPARERHREPGHRGRGCRRHRLRPWPLGPMVGQLERRYGRAPDAMLVDNGFVNLGETRRSPEQPRGTVLYAPPTTPRDPTATRMAAPRRPPAVAAWRTRMGTSEAKAIYRERAATAECVNAIARNRGCATSRSEGSRKRGPCCSGTPSPITSCGPWHSGGPRRRSDGRRDRPHAPLHGSAHEKPRRSPRGPTHRILTTEGHR